MTGTTGYSLQRNHRRQYTGGPVTPDILVGPLLLHVFDEVEIVSLVVRVLVFHHSLINGVPVPSSHIFPNLQGSCQIITANLSTINSLSSFISSTTASNLTPPLPRTCPAFPFLPGAELISVALISYIHRRRTWGGGRGKFPWLRFSGGGAPPPLKHYAKYRA